MKQILVTPLEARKLPRLALIALCVAYVVPGLLGRDPWSGDDAIAFGIVSSMLNGGMGGSGWLDWMLPSISGLPMVAKGPLTYWFGAAIASLMPSHTGIALRIAAGLWMAVMFITIWYAAYSLARRPEVQPNDPLNAAASRTDFGRAVADSCLLILMASLGLVARAHEFTAESFQVGLIGVFLLGCAGALRRPRRAGLLAGAAIGASLMVRGLPVAVVLLLCALSLPLLVRQYRLVSRSFVPSLVIGAVLIAGCWPLALFLTEAPQQASALTHLSLWWKANLSAIAFEPRHTLGWIGRNALWYAWPAWPVAVWALLRWRGKRLEPAIALPLVTIVSLSIAMLFSARMGEGNMLLLLPPFALLAAFGLPAISRSLVGLMDWFAVIIFSLFGVAAWAYWIAFVSGTPSKMARSAARYAAGYQPEVLGLPLTLGLLASLAWIVLIWWRTTRQARALWRPVALSSAGMALAWLLLMTLWLPVFNHRKTYSDLAQILSSAIAPEYKCISTLGVSASQRALFLQARHLNFEPVAYRQLQVARGIQITSEAALGKSAGARESTCDYLLIEDRSNQAKPIPGGSWQLVWEGRRPSDRLERFRLFRAR